MLRNILKHQNQSILLLYQIGNRYYFGHKIIIDKITIQSISYYISISTLCMYGRNIYRTRCIYSRSLKYPWTAGAIWTKISMKGEGMFLHFPSTFLSVSFHSLLYSSVPLSRIRRDRYCFLFPSGTLGQFQIGEQRSRNV